MTVLLEMKERLKLIYSKGEPLLLPLVKFLLAFVTFSTLNSSMGYMTQVDNVAVVLIVALLCSFLPVGALVFFGAIFSLAHMYALSIEVAFIGVCVYLVMYLLFFRFSPKDSLVVVMTPLMCALKIPYVVPIVVGLLCGPMSIVSVSCGVIVYYLIETVAGNASNIRTMGDEEVVEKIRLLIESIIGNKAMMVVIVSFAITVLVVYLLRRMSIDYSWTIAMVAGAMMDVVVLLIGDLLYDINISVGGALLGSVLGIAVAKVVEFFRFCVDYSRTEKVQFEDDEYYYYVKAIPKMSVAMSTKTVKKINSQQTREGAGARSSSSHQTDRVSQPVRSADRTSAERAGLGRSVSTERVPSNRSAGMGGVSSSRGMGGASSSRSASQASSDRSVGMGGTSRSAGQASGRSVGAERMASSRVSEADRVAHNNPRVGQRTTARNQGRSNVTIGSTVRQDTMENVRSHSSDDYEELF